MRCRAARAVGAITWIIAFGALSLTSAAKKPEPPPATLVKKKQFIRDDWLFEQKFLYKRDAHKNMRNMIKMRPTGLAEFRLNDKTKGFWRLERRLTPGQAKKKTKMNMFKKKKEEEPLEGVDYWVMDIPQDESHDVILTYEIPVARGKYHPTAVQFAREGTIYVWRQIDEIDEEEVYGVPPVSRKKVGTFYIDLKTLSPMVDRAFKA